MRVKAYHEACDKAPFGVVAKLCKLGEILIVRGDCGLHPALRTKPDYLFKRSKLSDKLTQFRVWATGAEPQANESNQILSKGHISSTQE